MHTFARLLSALAPSEPIRAIEAIAVVVANQVDEQLARQASAPFLPPVPYSAPSPGQRLKRFSDHLNVLCAEFGHIADISGENPIYAPCLRIAQRALAGAINDPTDGATLFHSSDAVPSWAWGLLPCAVIGNYFFYDGARVDRDRDTSADIGIF